MTPKRPRKAPAKAGARELGWDDGVVMLDPMPNPPNYFMSDEEARAREAEILEWRRSARGAEFAGGLVYMLQQLRVQGLDPREMVDNPVALRTAFALTRRPEIRERKPRQGKSRWPPQQAAWLVYAVAREMAAAGSTVGGPKLTVRQVCARLAKRSESPWRGYNGATLERRYRDATKQDGGHFVAWAMECIATKPAAERGAHYEQLEVVIREFPST